MSSNRAPDRRGDCELPDALPLYGGPLDGMVIDTRPDRARIFSGRPFRLGWGKRYDRGSLVTYVCTLPARQPVIAIAGEG